MVLKAWLLEAGLYITHQFKKTVRAPLANQHGAILIGLLITVVIFAALGAAMLPLSSTSSFEQVGAVNADEAYLLAESAYRFAANQYRHAGGDSQLETLHDQTFKMADGVSRFHLDIRPYFFKTTQNPGGGTQLAAAFPGGVPTDMDFTQLPGKLKIGSLMVDYTGANQEGKNIIFDTTATLPYYPVDTDVLPVAVSDNTVQTINKGEHLILESGENTFPLKNGTFQVNSHIYAYAENDRNTNQLKGITDPADPAMPTLTVTPNTPIVLQKFIKLQTTGQMVNQGTLSTSRKITYHVPLPYKTHEKRLFHDPFVDKSNWEATSTWGDHEVQTIDGDSALKVTDSQQVDTDMRGSLIALDRPATKQAMADAHTATGFFLSYDAQVKTGFDFFMVPPYFATGLSFRLDGDLNGYGVSFLRSRPPTAFPDDKIPDGIVPVPNTILMVLWQQTGNGTERNWLAYKDLDAVEFSVNEATLLVRLKEAATVAFNSGGLTGEETRIRAGDIVLQADGFKATVDGEPILQSGAWNTGDAQGILLVNNLSGTFQDDQALSVAGKSADIATGTGFRPRDNYIRAYYADTAGNGNPDGVSDPTPLDNIRHDYNRNQVAWPADDIGDTTAAEDYFTLVQWDAVNTSGVNTVQAVASLTEPDAIIRSNEGELLRTAGPLTDPELGLHAFGGDALTTVYYDDFALQLEIQRYFAPPSIQE